MISKGTQYLSAAGFGNIRVTAASMGSALVFWDWLLYATKQAILGAFGATDGAAVINATNAYLNQLAATQGKQAAQAMADYINAYPLAGIMNQDGLVFQMDCGYECSAAAWKDIKGNHDFEGTNVSLVDGVPYFNGTAWYRYASNLVFPVGSSTIEVVINWEGFTNSWGCVYCVGDTSGVIMALNTGEGTAFAYGSAGRAGLTATSMNSLQRISMNDNVSARNGVVMARTASCGITKQQASDTRIGCRSNSNSCFKGKIYAIRIYNRLLTEAEILANQDIDLKRFTPSTP